MQHGEQNKATASAHRRDADGTPENAFPLGFKEFVALMAALMAMNALSIDPMLPSLPDIAHSLDIVAVTDRHWIITVYFIGLGVGSLFYGSLSDRFGRRRVLSVTILLFLISTMLCAIASSFALLLAGRAMAGFFAAASRVIAVSIVRDRFAGDQMARIMSLIFIVFIIVPILAPTFGQATATLFGWRGTFWSLVLVNFATWVWMSLRLPETLRPENRVAIRASDIAATLKTVVTHRGSMGYMLATGVIMGSMISFITSVQPIMFDIFDAKAIFPIAFAGMAGSLGLGSFFNSRLVERLGARRLSQGALICFILCAGVHSLVAWLGYESLISFLLLQSVTMLFFAFSGSNFGSISMEPFARGAGLASSFQAFLTSLLSSLLGAFVASHYNGTTLPLALGFFCFGSVALLLVAWAEGWTLFTRPSRGNLREPQSVR